MESGECSEEILEEIEAVKAVYFNECTVVRVWPPYIKLELNTLTAEDVTQQVNDTHSLVHMCWPSATHTPLFKLRAYLLGGTN
jgi:hypothetical protein